jgi:DNA invertase Pin-like site-specific DNA recombinase
VRRAFSYTRFSTPKQADGFSLARQLDAAKAYCERNKLVLDDRTFLDLGVSGFHGSNSLAGDLAEFIGLVKDGRIPMGSVLIVENTDRLSRLPPDEANRIITGIVKAGVDIVTTSPEQVYTAANIDRLSTWLPLQVSNCLAREESVKKSDRLKDAWARKRADLANNKKMSKKGPFWLKLSSDRKTWTVVKRQANLVRQVFRWCASGLGVSKICERLHKEWPEGITGKGWQPNNVRKILRARSVLGEFQAFTGTCAKKGGIPSTRKAHGPPVVGYFPAIVSEADFYKAQQALDGRRKGGGRSAGTPNLFNGILYDATDGRRMVLNSDHGRRVLVSSGAIRKMEGSSFRSVSYKVFERAVLSVLRELKPADVVGKAGRAETDLEQFIGKLAAVNHNIAKTQERAAKAEDPTVFLDLLETLASQRKEIIAKLEAAKARAASPVSDTLGECSSLVKLMDDAEGNEKDELRTRVRTALRRLVEGIWVVIGCMDRVRLIQCQIWFRGGIANRTSLIVYDPPAWKGQSRFTGKVYVASVKHPDDGLWPIGNQDLRDPQQAEWMASDLENYPPDVLGQLLRRAQPIDE